MYFKSAFVGAVALASSAAMAQDAANFAGPRIEAHAGWDHVKVAGGKDDGVTYGGGIGYDFQVSPNQLVGIEANLNFSTVKECEDDILTFTDRLCVKAGRDFDVLARFGVTAGPNFLFYVKGGYANGRVKVTYRDTVAPANNDSDGANLDGFRIGAGGEYALSPSTYMKAEYQYTDYESGFERHQVLGGVGFRF